jgi:2-dehydropantoate 2-reductase
VRSVAADVFCDERFSYDLSIRRELCEKGLMTARADVLVHGAGAIGLYVGGLLARGGLAVHFVARSRIAETIRREGLTITDLAGRRTVLGPAEVSVGEALADAPKSELALLTVKSSATAVAAAELGAALPAGTPVLSLQNGVDNPDRIRAAAPTLVTIAGMVPFNVVQEAPGKVRQTTSGRLGAARSTTTEMWARRFAAADVPLDLHEDMRAVAWGKLLLNLNNPVNALSGAPLREELLDRGYRLVLADLMEEGLTILAAAGIRPAKVTPLPPAWVPTLLRLPTPVFRMLANRMLTIHPEARSSMYEDRVAGRTTEIGDLCGAVVRLAEHEGRTAPRNRRMVELIESVPAGRYYAAAELRALLAAPPT